MSRRNPKGLRSATGPVEYCEAPDLTGVSKSKKHFELAAESGSVEERVRYINERKSTRPLVTRWLNDDGSLVEQVGETKTRTGQCPECQRWFRVERAKEVRARWPKFCSAGCRDVVNRRKSREGMRKLRTEGYAIDYHITEFDPEHPDAEMIAQRIYESETRARALASPAARKAAFEYLQALWDQEDQWEAERKAQRQKEAEELRRLPTW